MPKVKEVKPKDTKEVVDDLLIQETSQLIFFRNKCNDILADRKQKLEASHAEDAEKLKELELATNGK